MSTLVSAKTMEQYLQDPSAHQVMTLDDLQPNDDLNALAAIAIASNADAITPSSRIISSPGTHQNVVNINEILSPTYHSVQIGKKQNRSTTSEIKEPVIKLNKAIAIGIKNIIFQVINEYDKWHTVGIFKNLTHTVSNFIEYEEWNSNMCENLTSDNLPNLSKLRRSNLEPGRAYRFRVSAINGCGRGDFGEVSPLHERNHKYVNLLFYSL